MSARESNHAIFVAATVVAGAVVALAFVGQLGAAAGFPLALRLAFGTLIGVGGVAGFAQKSLRALPRMGRRDGGTLARAALTGVGLSLAGSGALLIEQELIPAFGPVFAAKEGMMAALIGDSLPELLLALLVAAVVPAILEEWLFRGVLRTYLKRHTTTGLRVLVLGVLFSLFHVDPTVLIPMVYVGMVLSICAERADGWVAAVVAHFALNAFSLAVLSQLPVPESLWVGLGAVAVGGALATWAVDGMRSSTDDRAHASATN